MDIMTVREAAAKWGLTERHVTEIVRSGKIAGAFKIGAAWVMPADTQKPGHKKKQPKPDPIHAAASQTDLSKLSEPYKALIGNQGINHQILDLLPIPLHIFAPDGTVIFTNRANMEMMNCPDTSLIVGKYNLKHDPVCLEILGQETIDKIFRGESVSIPDFPAPIQDVKDRGVIDEKPFEAATMDMFLLPIWDGDIFTCTICFFTVKNMYQGRADIAKAQDYIEKHYQDEFDIDKIARSANLSKRHFQRIFKDVAGKTPMEHYQDVKIKKIQEKLLDDSLSIEQAFDVCGVSSHGAYLKLFKEKTKKSPLEYRQAYIKK